MEVKGSPAVIEYVPDSWPVMEWIKGKQPATNIFREMIEAAVTDEIMFSMSRINHGEVVYLVRKELPERLQQQALKAFAEIPIKLHSVDDLLVDEAVSLKCVYPISYADAFASALGLRLAAPVVTGDREFLKLEKIGLRLHWVGA